MMIFSKYGYRCRDLILRTPLMANPYPLASLSFWHIFWLDNPGDALRKEQIRIILGIAELPKDAWVLFPRAIT